MTKKERREKKLRIDTIRRNRKALGHSTKKCIVNLVESYSRTTSLEDAVDGFEKKGYRYEINDGMIIH